MSKDATSGVFVAAESDSKLVQTHLRRDLHRRTCDGQVSHAHQIVGCAGESEDPMHLADSAMPNLPHQRNRLQPAEALFDPFPLSLTEGVARVPRDTAINCAASAPPVV